METSDERHFRANTATVSHHKYTVLSAPSAAELLMMHSRVGGVLLTTELTVAVRWINDLPGVTVDPGWKDNTADLF